MAFQRATTLPAKLRMALVGPSGSGKTYTALRIGTALARRIALIDTERASARRYARYFNFDVEELFTFHPETYRDRIENAGRSGYDLVIVDSLSHAWAGREGALDLLDRAGARAGSADRFSRWREVTPLLNDLMDTIFSAPCHVIVTMRSKTEYVVENSDTAAARVKRVGLAPVQREGVEYEFDIVGDLDTDNTMTITKSRCTALHRSVFTQPGDQVADILLGWLRTSAPPGDEDPETCGDEARCARSPSCERGGLLKEGTAHISHL